jgi:D-xylose transport system permease protein
MGFDNPIMWVVALALGLLVGAVLGGFQGFIIAYIGVPSFIVTLGGFLIWRGAIFRMGDKQGQTLAPLNDTFQLLGGGAKGALGEWKSWVVALLACAGIVLSIVLARRRRQRHELGVRPLWVEIGLAVVGCAVVILAVGAVANQYDSPATGCS